MGWADKQLKKYRMHKQIDEALNSPKYKAERRKWEEQAVLQALLKFIFLGLLYLEENFHCKKNGFLKFIDFVKVTMKRIGDHDDEEFFVASNKWFIEKYDLDVMEHMGLEIVKKGATDERVN